MADPEPVQGLLKVPQHGNIEFGELQAAHQRFPGKAEQVVKGPHIGFDGGPLKIGGVGLDAGIQRRGQLQGGLDPGLPADIES